MKYREFKDSQTNIHDEQMSERLSIVTDRFVYKRERMIREDRHLTGDKLHTSVLKSGRTVVYEKERSTEKWDVVDAQPHTAQKMVYLFNSFIWDILNHPAHSPDLALSDFLLFIFLKDYTDGKCF